MESFDATDLTIDYECRFRGIAGPDHDLEDYALHWRASASHWDDEAGETHIGEARFALIPDPGDIALLDTLDAISGELHGVGWLVTSERPHLMEILGDLLYLSSVEIEPRFRGHDLGHAFLTSILSTVGRTVGLVVLEPAPLLMDDEEEKEETMEHTVARAALRRYWIRYGFVPMTHRYLAYDATVRRDT